MDKLKVLFLCTGNSARSQMAEALLRHYGGEQFDTYSAGFEPQGINPYTLLVMEEKGISMEGQYSKEIREYMGKMHFSHVITVCSNAEARCPAIFPGAGKMLHWKFDDPAAAEGTDQEKLSKFREIRNQIEESIKIWLQNIQRADFEQFEQ